MKTDFNELIQRYMLMLFLILSYCLICEIAEAIECYECHGTKNPADYRPADATYRNITSGGFRGNHRTHLGPDILPVSCDPCHAGSTGNPSDYSQGHRDGKIQLSDNINNSPHPDKGTYSKDFTKAVFFNQTTIPKLGSCANVNCHFERETPNWGSNRLATTCNTCHDAPPTDGSHSQHGALACTHCHPDNTTFGHATSAGKRPLILRFTAVPDTASGSYSGNVSYPDYLPSKNPPRNGSCQNIYCHSDGKGGPPKVTPVWSGSLPSDCAGCHGSANAHGAPDYPNAGIGLPRANSHDKHVQSAADCGKCHAGTTTSGTAIKAGSLLHVNKVIDVTFNTDMSGGGATWTTGTADCSAVYCHTDGTSLATGQIAGGNASWGGEHFACNNCHSYPPSYGNGLPKANSHLSHNFNCNLCHAGITADGTTIADRSRHGNHIYDLSAGAGISFSYVFATTGGICLNISCHNNGTAVWGESPSLTCGSCHSASPGGD